MTVLITRIPPYELLLPFTPNAYCLHFHSKDCVLFVSWCSFLYSWRSLNFLHRKWAKKPDFYFHFQGRFFVMVWVLVFLDLSNVLKIYVLSLDARTCVHCFTSPWSFVNVRKKCECHIFFGSLKIFFLLYPKYANEFFSSFLEKKDVTKLKHKFFWVNFMKSRLDVRAIEQAPAQPSVCSLGREGFFIIKNFVTPHFLCRFFSHRHLTSPKGFC